VRKCEAGRERERQRESKRGREREGEREREREIMRVHESTNGQLTRDPRTKRKRSANEALMTMASNTFVMMNISTMNIFACVC